MGLSIYQFANPITNENSTYLGILLLNNKLQAVMPYTSDFYTFTLLRQWKGGTSFQKKRARSKVLEAKSSIFHFWQKSDQGLCKQNMKVCILWVKVLWVHTLLFLISYFIFTSYFYRWKGSDIDDNERLLKTFGVRFLYTVQGKRSSQLSKQRRDRFFPFSTNS